MCVASWSIIWVCEELRVCNCSVGPFAIWFLVLFPPKKKNEIEPLKKYRWINPFCYHAFGGILPRSHEIKALSILISFVLPCRKSFSIHLLAEMLFFRCWPLSGPFFKHNRTCSLWKHSPSSAAELHNPPPAPPSPLLSLHHSITDTFPRFSFARFSTSVTTRFKTSLHTLAILLLKPFTSLFMHRAFSARSPRHFPRPLHNGCTSLLPFRL